MMEGASRMQGDQNTPPGRPGPGRPEPWLKIQPEQPVPDRGPDNEPGNNAPTEQDPGRPKPGSREP